MTEKGLAPKTRCEVIIITLKSPGVFLALLQILGSWVLNPLLVLFLKCFTSKYVIQDLPRGPVIKNPPANAGLTLVLEDPWRRKWQPTPVFLPGESHGQRSLAGCSPCDLRESDTTEVSQHAHREDPTCHGAIKPAHYNS